MDHFRRNPQEFVELAAEAMDLAKRLALVPGIKYERPGGEEYYVQELFGQEELDGYLKNESVKAYAKLPTWFMVLTPLGATATRTWAVLVQADGRRAAVLRIGFEINSRTPKRPRLTPNRASIKIKTDSTRKEKACTLLKCRARP